MEIRIFLDLPPTCLTRDNQPPVGLPSCVPSWLVTDTKRGRNINRLSIGYACRPRLRAPLTLRGRAFRKKPWPYRGQEFPLSFLHSSRPSSLRLSPEALRASLYVLGTDPHHP